MVLSFPMNTIKLCGLGFNDTHLFDTWLPLIPPTCLLYWETQCFERTFCFPTCLSLQVPMDALLASKVLTRFCYQNCIHFYHPTQVPSSQDPPSPVSLPAGRSPPAPGYTILHSLFPCVLSHRLPCILLFLFVLMHLQYCFQD